MIYGKKGDEKILTIWMFVIWIIIGMAIIAGVFWFNGSPLDFREIQSKILADKIAQCIFDNGQLYENYLNKDFELINYCKLNQQMFDKGLIYFNVSTIDRNSGVLLREDIIRGDPNFQIMCGLAVNEKSENLAKCASERYSGIYGNKDVLMIINTGSNNLGGSS